MKSLCIITPRYPTSLDPSAMSFVQQLALTFADEGVGVSVICPLPVNRWPRLLLHPKRGQNVSKQGSRVEVMYPFCLNFGTWALGCLNFNRLSNIFFYRAVRMALSSLSQRPDALYGHFIAPAGHTAAMLGRQHGIPAFLAFGESTLWSIKHLKKRILQQDLSCLSGVIAVSSQNKKVIEQTGILSPSTLVRVFPNSIRDDLFYPRDRGGSRRRFGIGEDQFVVCFVGHFIQRKGIQTLGAALARLDQVYAIYAGKGKLVPNPDTCLFQGILAPEELPYFYSAADVFVLPTLNEGMSNAIVEAMACGLPIISSDLSFNDDVLDESNSLRVDPKDVDALALAIRTLRDDRALRARLAAGSLEKAKSLTLKVRARNILNFMDETIRKGMCDE